MDVVEWLRSILPAMRAGSLQAELDWSRVEFATRHASEIGVSPGHAAIEAVADLIEERFYDRRVMDALAGRD